MRSDHGIQSDVIRAIDQVTFPANITTHTKLAYVKLTGTGYLQTGRVDGNLAGLASLRLSKTEYRRRDRI